MGSILAQLLPGSATSQCSSSPRRNPRPMTLSKVSAPWPGITTLRLAAVILGSGIRCPGPGHCPPPCPSRIFFIQQQQQLLECCSVSLPAPFAPQACGGEKLSAGHCLPSSELVDSSLLCREQSVRVARGGRKMPLGQSEHWMEAHGGPRCVGCGGPLEAAGLF